MSALVLDFRMLEDSVYKLKEQQVNVMDRLVFRYKLEENPSDETIDSAYQVVNDLLRKNADSLFLAADQGDIREKIRHNPYLVINERAVCLTNETRAPDSLDIKCRDVFFSEACIQEPVSCSLGRHNFEKEYIEAWKQKVGDRCPCEPEHVLGELVQDPYVKADITATIRKHEKDERIENDLKQQIEELKDKKEIDRISFLFLERLKSINQTELKVGSATLKGAGKTYTALALKTSCKGGECVFHVWAKKVPVICLVAGVSFAAARVYNGEYWKAGGEILSGACAMVPGYGTAASLAIDAVLVGHDVFGEEKKETLSLRVEDAHKALGLDSKSVATKAQIDEAFHRASRFSNSDHVQNEDDDFKKKVVAAQVLINKSREILYTYYKY